MNGLRLTLAASVAAAALCTSLPARADGDSGISIGVRTGYGAAIGSAFTIPNSNAGLSMASFEGGMLPFWFDLNYRFDRHWAAGIWYQFAITAPPNSQCNSIGAAGTGSSCDGNDQRFGIEASYHFTPDKIIDPWVGLGVGYEVARVNYGQPAAGGETSVIGSGFQYLDLQAGADLRLSDRIPFGPFIDLSFGKLNNWSLKDSSGNSRNFDGTGGYPEFDGGTHEWLTIGLRAQFNL